MKWRAVLTVCVAVGSLKLASSSATPPHGENRPPTTVANYRGQQQPSTLAPNGRPGVSYVADPTLLLKALPAAVAAFVDALAALTSNQATPSPSVTSTQATPTPSVTSNQATSSPSVTRVPPEPTTYVPTSYPQPYAIFRNFRTAMPWYVGPWTFLHRGFASHWPPVFVRQSFATIAAEPEKRVSGESIATIAAEPEESVSEESIATIAAEPEESVSEESTTANPTEPEQPVSGEPESVARHSDFDQSFFEYSTITSAPDVAPSDSTTVAAVPDHVVVTGKPSDSRPHEYQISFPTQQFDGFPLKKQHKVYKVFFNSNKILTEDEHENEIPSTE